MKHVISVSLGSSKRNHSVEIELLGEKYKVERIGTNGDMEAMIRMFRELDGKVDAFGLGGMDLYIFAGEKRYTLREAIKVVSAVQLTPILDGSGLKNTLERKAIKYLEENTSLIGPETKVLIVCAMDRFGMAQSLDSLGCKLVLGDLMFVLGLPIPLRKMKTMYSVAKVLVPLVRLLPFKYLYPTGSKQEEVKPKFSQYYLKADIIAGDYHFIRRNMPPGLEGKSIITNTVTSEDVQMLKERGIKYLVTTTPEIQGRSFGTNVMEALLVAASGKTTELTPGEYSKLLSEINFAPRVELLNP
ncbi:quinate 5-dehydrogenase [Candidatus Contubernalis alkaliaceticus]|uniref:quinate 5-dehydrogenase n=1 Tax=Candidatus Contubernalis alkaliaceticus TaxID=338645 RepID=UPI001F4C4E26|nr:quinate 5-dehydrogenase [Candidatus Contubernalis alkalaceticus]UNC93410.1 quinate 5-dehydrogenase [Candidatus Contubernalis alkalaceticus]